MLHGNNYMKRKDLNTLRDMKPTELVKAISETKHKLAEILVNRYSKQSKNSREGRLLARKIAIIETLIRQKELTHE